MDSVANAFLALAEKHSVSPVEQASAADTLPNPPSSSTTTSSIALDLAAHQSLSLADFDESDTEDGLRNDSPTF